MLSDPRLIPILKARHHIFAGFLAGALQPHLFQEDKSDFSGYITNTYYCFRYTAVVA